MTASFTVMTANVGNGLATDARLVEALLLADADLIAIEELNRRQARVLDTVLADAYPWRAFFEDGYEGKGILSRLPMRDAMPLNLVEGRPDCMATFTVGAQDVRVVVAHPRPPRVRRNGILFDRSSQRHIVRIGMLIQEIAPGIVLGDFNMTPRHPGYARLRRLGLHDAFGEVGATRGATFPIRLSAAARRHEERESSGRPRMTPPLVRFDYVWYTDPLVAESAWIGPDTGSDHLPVMARLTITSG